MTLLPLGILASSGGGGASFELISTQVLESAVSSVTFSSIPATYTHLQLRVVGRASSTGNSTAVLVKVNNDSSSIYAVHSLTGNGSSVTSFGLGATAPFLRGIDIPDAATVANGFGVSIMDFVDYASTSKYKTMRALYGKHSDANQLVGLASGVYQSTSAISRLDLTPQNASNLVVGSRFSLYGIKG